MQPLYPLRCSLSITFTEAIRAHLNFKAITGQAGYPENSFLKILTAVELLGGSWRVTNAYQGAGHCQNARCFSFFRNLCTVWGAALHGPH